MPHIGSAHTCNIYSFKKSNLELEIRDIYILSRFIAHNNYIKMKTHLENLEKLSMS